MTVCCSTNIANTTTTVGDGWISTMIIMQ